MTAVPQPLSVQRLLIDFRRWAVRAVQQAKAKNLVARRRRRRWVLLVVAAAGLLVLIPVAMVGIYFGGQQSYKAAVEKRSEAHRRFVDRVDSTIVKDVDDVVRSAGLCQGTCAVPIAGAATWRWKLTNPHGALLIWLSVQDAFGDHPESFQLLISALSTLPSDELRGAPELRQALGTLLSRFGYPTADAPFVIRNASDRGNSHYETTRPAPINAILWLPFPDKDRMRSQWMFSLTRKGPFVAEGSWLSDGAPPEFARRIRWVLKHTTPATAPVPPAPVPAAPIAPPSVNEFIDNSGAVMREVGGPIGELVKRSGLCAGADGCDPKPNAFSRTWRLAMGNGALDITLTARPRGYNLQMRAASTLETGDFLAAPRLETLLSNLLTRVHYPDPAHPFAQRDQYSGNSRYFARGPLPVDARRFPGMRKEWRFALERGGPFTTSESWFAEAGAGP